MTGTVGEIDELKARAKIEWSGYLGTLLAKGPLTADYLLWLSFLTYNSY